MKLDDIVSKAYNTNWVLSDEFIVEIDPSKPNDITQDEWNMAIISMTTPELSSQTSDLVLGGSRRITSRIQDVFRFTITFRDFDQNKLRSYFETKFALQQKLYPEDIETEIIVRHLKKDIGSIIFSTRALITNISGANFNNSESGIQEFTVSFSSSWITNNNIPFFGTSTFNEYIDALMSRIS